MIDERLEEGNEDSERRRRGRARKGNDEEGKRYRSNPYNEKKEKGRQPNPKVRGKERWGRMETVSFPQTGTTSIVENVENFAFIRKPLWKSPTKSFCQALFSLRK